MITIYHNPRCRKSREALGLIEESGQPYEVVEYLKKPLSVEDLGTLLQKLDMKPMELVRRNEADWKEHFRGRELSDSEILNAMARYPKLMERPVAVRGNRAVLGRPPENVLGLLRDT
jgi:arsenate reductase